MLRKWQWDIFWTWAQRGLSSPPSTHNPKTATAAEAPRVKWSRLMSKKMLFEYSETGNRSLSTWETLLVIPSLLSFHSGGNVGPYYTLEGGTLLPRAEASQLWYFIAGLFLSRDECQYLSTLTRKCDGAAGPSDTFNQQSLGLRARVCSKRKSSLSPEDSSALSPVLSLSTYYLDGLKCALQAIPFGKFDNINCPSPEVQWFFTYFFFHHRLWNYDKSYNLLTHVHSNLHTIMLYCIGNEYF